jgi:hypothetical protein
MLITTTWAWEPVESTCRKNVFAFAVLTISTLNAIAHLLESLTGRWVGERPRPVVH